MNKKLLLLVVLVGTLSIYMVRLGVKEDILTLNYLKRVKSNAKRNLESMKDKACNGVEFSADGKSSEEQRTFVDTTLSARGGNQVEKLLNKETTAEEYVTGLIPFVAPWIVLLGLSQIGWFCYLYYCCYSGECCCKPCCCCKREKPYTKFDKLCPLITFWVANLGVFILALIGFGISNDWKNGFNQTQCSLYTFTDQIINGDGGKWSGVNPAIDKIVSIKTQINDATTNVYSQFTKIGWIDDNYTTLATQINTINATHNTSSIKNPAGGSNLSLEFLVAGITKTLNTELTVQIQGIKTVIQPISQSAKGISDTTTGFTSAIDKATEPLKDFQVQIVNFENDTGKTTDQVEGIINDIYSGLQGIMSTFLVASIIGYVSTIAYLITRGKIFKCCIHFTWCLMSLLMVFSFILALILSPVGVVSVEVCDILMRFVNNQTSASSLIPAEISSKIGTCIYPAGTGNLLDGFGDLNTQIEKIKNLTDLSSQTQQVKDLKANFSDASQFSASKLMVDKLDNITSFQQSLFAGQNPESDTVALDATNQLVQTVCGTTDQWAFITAKCDGNHTTAATTNDYKQNTNINNNICLAIGDPDFQILTPPSGTTSSTDRYTVKCADNVTNIGNALNSLDNYYDSVSKDFDNLRNDIDKYRQNNQNYTGRLIGIFDPLINLPDKVKALIDTILDPNTGLISQMNCKFIGINMNKLLTSMCGEFIFSLYSLGLVIGIAGCFMFVSGFFACIIGIRVKKAFPNPKDAGQMQFNDQFNNNQFNDQYNNDNHGETVKVDEDLEGTQRPKM